MKCKFLFAKNNIMNKRYKNKNMIRLYAKKMYISMIRTNNIESVM